VDVDGLGSDVDGRHVLTAVTHVVDRERGYVTRFSTEPPPARPRPEGFMAAAGTVTRIDDPDGLGRVRVELPALDRLESDWMGVVTPAAGPRKGLVALPDVGDEVLAWLSRENPAQGVVLGAVFGSRGMPDTGIEDGVVARYALITPGGQRLRLDDAGRSLRLETTAGSSLEFLPDHVTLHAAADLTIEAPGRRLLFRADKVDFRRG
jgi:uncharacterized protein involved in type VI secretion and phage assembly